MPENPTPTPPGGDGAEIAPVAPPPPKRGPGHRGQDIRDTMAEMAAKAHEISLEAGSRMAATMREVIGAAAGISAFAIESARDLVNYMVRRGQMSQDEANKLMREVEEAHASRPKVTGTGFATHDFHWIRSHIPDGLDARLIDVTSSNGVLSLMGPKARDVLSSVTEAESPKPVVAEIKPAPVKAPPAPPPAAKAPAAKAPAKAAAPAKETKEAKPAAKPAAKVAAKAPKAPAKAAAKPAAKKPEPKKKK